MTREQWEYLLMLARQDAERIQAQRVKALERAERLGEMVHNANLTADAVALELARKR